MKEHKSQALESNCKCEECSLRFTCFTQERVFSDPIFQGLYEALLAQGKTKEEALEEVVRELKWKMTPPAPVTIPSIPYVQPQPPYTIFNDWVSGGYSNGNVSFSDVGDNKVQVSYTMSNGERVEWNADADTLRVCHS